MLTEKNTLAFCPGPLVIRIAIQFIHRVCDLHLAAGGPN